MYYGFAEPVIIAGPRNAHLRPLIPPLAILFSSLLARALRPSSPGHQSSLFPGPRTSPLSRRAVVSFSPRRRIALSRRRFVTSMRPFYNHYRFSQLDRGCAPRRASLSLSISRSPPFSFSFLRLFVSPSSRLFTPRISRSRPEFRCSQLRDGPTMKRRWDARSRARPPTFTPVLLLIRPRRKPRAAEIYYRDARALILDLARTLRGTIVFTFDFRRRAPRTSALRLRDYANS